jgi:hypothetical protein
MADRAVKYERRLRATWGATDLGRRWVTTHWDRVLRGPVAGTRYFEDGDSVVAKFVGAYELELHGWLEEGLPRPTRFVCLGAADGYWAVGIAARHPQIKVEAFELSETLRERVRQATRRNGARVSMRRRATSSGLASGRLDGALVLCDVEGAEDVGP